MSTQADRVKPILRLFSLTETEVLVYLYIIENGESSPLEISRKTSIARTKVYRTLDKLKTKGLVIEQVSYPGSRFIPNTPDQFELLVAQKEHEAKILKENLPTLVDEVKTLISSAGPHKSKVLYYKGIEGLKQVTWNSLKAEGELLTMEIADMNAFLDEEFSEKVRQEVVRRKIFTKNLTNRQKFPPWTRVSDYVKNLWEVRYINPEEFQINFDILIYNDVYCLYDYTDNEIFCVEIYNEKLVKMQKQIYDFIWKHAQRMQVLNDRGEAEVC